MVCISLMLKNILLVILILLIPSAYTNLNDPYTILGVGKYATNQEIRRAYKQLAKEWHPDKTNHPDADTKFVQIKQAYELLNDAERRRIYDHHGITNEDSHFFKKQQHDYSQYGRFASDLFEDFFEQRFNSDQDISIYHKLTVTAKYFEQSILSKSSSVPHILIFYSDWCFRCTRLVGVLKKLMDNLEPLGVNFASINVAYERTLVRKIGINDVPSLVLVLHGHCFIYRDSLITVQKILEFIRKKLPYKLVLDIADSNINRFLDGWMDNRVRALVLEPKDHIKLRYLITAFSFRFRVAFGFVQINSEQCRLINERFNVRPNFDTLLVFNEETERPVARVSMSDIPTQTFKEILSSNQYLALPRLSSQDMFEGVCPAEWSRPRKLLCVVLITENTNAHNYARAALRQMAQQSAYNPERVRFAYMFKDKQQDFMNAISKGSSEDKSLHIVIIWRRDTSHVKYEWIHSANMNLEKSSQELRDNFFNSTKYHLDNAIHRLLQTSETLSYEAFVKDLVDEHAQGYFSQWFTRLLYLCDYLLENIEQEHILATLSVLCTIAFMFAIGYLMVYLVHVEEQNLKTKGQLNSNTVSKPNRYVPELKLHELRAEKYNGMVRLLKPGCRTVVLITDRQSRPKLIPGFHKAVWPYRKTKTLLFGHMLIEKGLAWYSELLRLSLSESRELQINPRNCIGTVLALNGHRKYFCMYHAKHPESNRGAKRMLKMTHRLKARAYDPEAGLFLRDTNSEDSEIESEPIILLEENLLDGLSNWLDRLFEGSTHRYYINYWPDFPTK